MCLCYGACFCVCATWSAVYGRTWAWVLLLAVLFLFTRIHGVFIYGVPRATRETRATNNNRIYYLSIIVRNSHALYAQSLCLFMNSVCFFPLSLSLADSIDTLTEECTQDRCGRFPCRHGGKCLPSDQGAICLCPLGFGGDLCEMRLDLQVSTEDATAMTTATG